MWRTHGGPWTQAKVPGITIATDIICGFPGETQEDWDQTMDLCRKYKFIELHLSQFYPRPGTPAARMKRVDTKEVKRRSRELTAYIESYLPHGHLEGTEQRVWVTDTVRSHGHSQSKSVSRAATAPSPHSSHSLTRVNPPSTHGLCIESTLSICFF